MYPIAEDEGSDDEKDNGMRNAPVKGHGIQVVHKCFGKNVQVRNGMADRAPDQCTIAKFFAQCRLPDGGPKHKMS